MDELLQQTRSAVPTDIANRQQNETESERQREGGYVYSSQIRIELTKQLVDHWSRM